MQSLNATKHELLDHTDMIEIEDNTDDQINKSIKISVFFNKDKQIFSAKTNHKERQTQSTRKYGILAATHVGKS